MFKRFTCMILSFVLLLALVPAAALEASAAANATSDSAITILKKLESFADKCDASGYTGYGTKCEETGRHGVRVAHGTGANACNTNGYLKDGVTPCPKNVALDGPHGAVHIIREDEASADLKEAMKKIDTAINTFASNRGISLSQQQHDALAVFSFENGTGWTKGTDDLQNAVATGITGRNFVKVMTNWKAGTADDARRQVEANMYLFGEYNTTASRLETNLVNAEKANTSSEEDLVNSVRVLATVTNAYINVREKANIFSGKVGTVYAGDQLRVTDTKENNGYLWGRIVDANYEKIGYVALMYTNYDELVTSYEYEKNNAANSAPKVVASVTVNVNGYVNVRSGAGTQNPIVSSLRNGTKVDLYEIRYVNGQKWGRYDVGWFSLAYANTDATGETNDYNYINFLFKGKLKASTDMYKSRNVTDVATLTAAERAQLWTISNITFDGTNMWGKANNKYWVLIDNIDLATDAANIATFTSTTKVAVREGASVTDKIKTYLAAGTEIDIDLIEADNNTIWGFSDDIQVGQNKYFGWVDLSTQYFTRKGAALATTPDTSKEKVELATVVDCVELNVRNKPSVFGTKVATLPAGTIVEMVEGPVNGSRRTGWYRLEIMQGDGTQCWVRGDYIDIREGTRGEINYGQSAGAAQTSPDGTQAATGRGMVANTYGGVNVRTAPGTANAKVTKLLPGTEVTILSVTMYGTTKWGKIDQGWVCMDYIAMMDYDDLPGTSTNVSSTVAIYEGSIIANGVNVYQEADLNSAVVRTLNAGDNINLHELLTVSSVISDDGTTTTTRKMHWARVNDGYICDTNMERNNLNQIIELNDLYEQVYTVTETEMLKVRENPGADQTREDLDLKKGDQVKITMLAIAGDQVWGRFDNDGLTDGEGWICLAYCTKGAIDTTTPPAGEGGENGGNAVPGETQSVGNTGKGNYMGTIIGKYPEVNVRKDPSTGSEKVTELKKGAAVTITETCLADNRSWGYCGTGWIDLLYVDLTPVGITAIDAKVIGNAGAAVYESSSTDAKAVGSYARRAVVNIYEEMNGMYKTDMGWIAKGNCL